MNEYKAPNTPNGEDVAVGLTANNKSNTDAECAQALALEVYAFGTAATKDLKNIDDLRERMQKNYK